MTVTPAEAGVPLPSTTTVKKSGIPAFAGMTNEAKARVHPYQETCHHAPVRTRPRSNA
jgi:hypothetical protein